MQQCADMSRAEDALALKVCLWYSAKSCSKAGQEPGDKHLLYVLQVFTDEGLIYMVQEYGEIDLARLLAKHDAARKEAGALKDNIDENFIRLYWQQMLQVRQAISQLQQTSTDCHTACVGDCARSGLLVHA